MTFDELLESLINGDSSDTIYDDLRAAHSADVNTITESSSEKIRSLEEALENASNEIARLKAINWDLFEKTNAPEEPEPDEDEATDEDVSLDDLTEDDE